MDSYGDLYKSNGIGEDTIRQYEYNLAKQGSPGQPDLWSRRRDPAHR